jgi:DNA-binding transcriptional ArsR family regulator
MNYSSLFKILADDNRLKILSLLSEKNLCGCNILETFKYYPADIITSYGGSRRG